MGDCEASTASTSPTASKRPAEPDPGVSDQQPSPKQTKGRKANATSIHDEFTRYTYTDKGGEQRTGSKCNECGFLMKDINPTNLKLHVQRKHREVYDKVMARDKAHQESFKKSIKELGKPTTESLLVPPKEPKGKGKAQIWSPEQQRHGDLLLAAAVAGSCLPMNFVRDSNMKNWVKYIAPQYKLPCDRKLKSDTRELTGMLRKKIHEDLRTARRVSITTDIWSQKLGVHSYSGVTGHFINTKENRRQSIILACRQFDEAHTGLAIADKMMEILKENGIEDKTFFCITDSASNMIKGLNDFNNLRTREMEAREDRSGDLEEEFASDPYCQEEQDNDPHFLEEIAIINKGLEEMEEKMANQCGVHCSTTVRLPCCAHKVHLVVEKCVTERMQCFGPLLKRVRRMVVKYRMSSKAKAFFVTVFYKRMPGYIASRWWTDIIMLEVFLEAANDPKQPLYHLSVHMQWGITFSNQEIKELEKLMSIMRPMEKLFCQLNSEISSAIHLVYPTVKAALKTLEPLVNDEFDSANHFAKEMKAQLESYFAFLLFPSKPEFLPIYWVASFLCPVYRSVITSEEMPVVRAYLEGAISPLVPDEAPAPASNNNIKFVLPGGLSCLSDGLSQTLARNESERNMREKLDKDIETFSRAADLHLAGLQAEAVAEAKRNGKTEAEIVAKDPLDFWFAQESSKNYQTDLPQYAQDVTACPPTSVPSERMFSLSGKLSDGRFSSILPENLENRMLVKANKYI